MAIFLYHTSGWSYIPQNVPHYSSLPDQTLQRINLTGETGPPSRPAFVTRMPPFSASKFRPAPSPGVTWRQELTSEIFASGNFNIF